MARYKECRCGTGRRGLGLPRAQRTQVPTGEAPTGHMGDSLDVKVNDDRRDYHKLNKKRIQ